MVAGIPWGWFALWLGARHRPSLWSDQSETESLACTPVYMQRHSMS